MKPNVDKEFPGDAEKIEMFIGKEVLELLCEPEFQNSWDVLYETCSWATVFQSRHFVSTWFRIYHNEYLPIIITGGNRSKLTGMLALARDNSGLITGAGASQAEYQVWLAHGNEGERFIKNALMEVRKKFRGSGIELKYIPGKVSMNWTRSEQVYNRYYLLRTFKHPLLKIDGTEISKELRKKNRKEKINRLKRLGELRFERITDMQVFSAIFDELASQYDFRKIAMFNITCFHKNSLRKEFLLALFEQNLLHATVLKLNDEIIASNIGTTGKKWVHLQGINTHAPAYARYSPGNLHFLMLGAQLADEGVEVFDLTPGTESYKQGIASEYSLAYTLSIDNFFNQFKYKLRLTFNDFFKNSTSKVGITYDTLLIQKWRVKQKIDKIRMARKQGILPIIKSLYNYVRLPSKIKKYHITPIDNVQPNFELLTIQKNSLSALLDFEQQDIAMTRWEFIATAMRRFEEGEHCFSWAEAGRLMACVWVGSPKPIAEGKSQSTVDEQGTIIMQGLYCHSSGRNKLETFLKATAAQVADIRDGAKVFAATADPELCQILETAFKSCSSIKAE